jgi:hypothetical protein
MTGRERIKIVLSGGIPDRVPFHDSYWATTVQRWRQESFPLNVSLDEHFDYGKETKNCLI